MTESLTRHAQAVVVEALADARVVLVHGPRQCGKTTLVQAVAASRRGRYLSLDSQDLRDSALRDPDGFVEGTGLVVIDEFQRGGDALLLAIKRAVDVAGPRRRRFLLAGSTRFLTVPTLSESLAGRIDIIDLWPLSQGELLGRREDFPAVLFGGPERLRSLEPTPLGRESYFDLACRGGFPEAVRRKPRSRERWFDGYARTLLGRDLLEIARVGRTDDVSRLLRLLATRTAAEVDVTAIARELGIPRTTLDGYLPLLESLFLLHRVPAWSSNLTAKIVRRPKLHFTDTGLAASLVGVTPKSLTDPTAPMAGPLLETFVVGEISRQLGWSAVSATVHHFRDRSGPEVDLVLESRDGRIAAIEVKAARSVSARDFSGLTLLRDRLGARFVQGVVLHAGEAVLAFGDRLSAAPVSAVWAT
ncbi:MAG: ATP-binding protein [Planctomycetes bacterium]|nr:ATP-binding protein [Planctomycetota bacterium]